MKKLNVLLLLLITVLAAPQAIAQARVAVLLLAPFDASIENTAVDILINGEVALENVQYKHFVDYIELPAGDFTADIVPVGAENPALSPATCPSRALNLKTER